MEQWQEEVLRSENVIAYEDGNGHIIIKRVSEKGMAKEDILALFKGNSRKPVVMRPEEFSGMYAPRGIALDIIKQRDL